MRYRRWLPRFDPHLRTTVNLSESYRDHDLHVVVSRVGLASTTCAVHVDGRRISYEVVDGSEPEVLIVGLRAALRVVDEMIGAVPDAIEPERIAMAMPGSVPTSKAFKSR